MSWIEDDNGYRDRRIPPPRGAPSQERRAARPPWEQPGEYDRRDPSRESWVHEQFERQRTRERLAEQEQEQEPSRPNWFVRGLIAIVVAGALVWLFLELGGSLLSTRYSGF
jgi:hypothetical protein